MSNAVASEQARDAEKAAKRTLRQAKARAIVVPIEKATEASAALTDDPFHSMGEGQAIVPPFDPLALTVLAEQNHELGQVIDAMAQNIDGFGHAYVARANVPDLETAARGGSDAAKRQIAEVMLGQIRAERVRLENFFNYASLDHPFTEIRKRTRQDLERTGNAYWEVLPGENGEIQGFEHIRAYQMRLCAQDGEAITADVPILELKEDGSWEVSKIQRRKRFRRFLQARYLAGTFGAQAVSEPGFVFFKEFGDPRRISRKTGKVIPEGKKVDPSELAHEIIHFSIYSARSPYGIPRYIGGLLKLYGMRAAEEVNYKTLTSNNIPSMMLLVSNGQLTDGSIQRITDFTESVIAEGQNYSKFLVVEAEPIDEDGEDGGQMKIEVEPLNQAQIRDAMFQKYVEAGERLAHRLYRMPPIFVGASDDYTRSTADTSRRLGDEQIFAPERMHFDELVNRSIFPRMGVRFFKFKSNSPNTTDNAELVKILAGSEKTGGMTPRIARLVMTDILGQELPPLPPDFPADVPFSLTMAEAVKNQADPAEPGQQVTALKRLELVKSLTGFDDEGALELDGLIVERLESIQKRLERTWKDEVTGLSYELSRDD
jgi:PBSX family phage portal protein